MIKSPLTPIFDPGIMKGTVNVGTTPGEPPSVTPELLDTLPFTAFSNIVAVGDYLYVTAPSDFCFYVVDKTDPSNLGTPAPFGTVDQRPIAALGSNIFVVGSNELRVWSISTPATPSLVGSTSTGGAIANANGMVASGVRVYLTNFAGDQVRNFNVTTPASPTLTSTLTNGTTLNGANGIAFSGSHVFVAATDGDRLTSVNISVPATMVVADNETHADLNECNDVQLNLTYAYVISPTGLVVYDKSTPTAMTYVTTVLIPDAVAIEVGGNHAYVITDDGIGSGELVIVDISTPAAPAVIPAATVSGLLGAPRDLVVDDDVLYVTDEGVGAIFSFDVSDYA